MVNAAFLNMGAPVGIASVSHGAGRPERQRHGDRRVVNWPMAFSAADIEMVDHHIAQGERHVARQTELVEWLKSRGHPTALAEQLLEDFRSTLDQHREHRTMMMLDVEPDPLRPIARGRAPQRGSPPRKPG